MPNAKRLEILKELREEATPRISQTDAARFFGLNKKHSYKSIAEWENGQSVPHEKRRENFLLYLWQKLSLHREPERLREVWQILVDEWSWDPLSTEEKKRYALNSRDDLTTSSFDIMPSKPKLYPLQRPLRPPHFVGREIEIEEVIQNLRSGRVLTLCGPGGVGKSAIAAEVIWRLTEENRPLRQFPDGIIWHDFYYDQRVDIVLENIARSFSVEPLPTPLEAAKRILSQNICLLLLDGAEAADNLHLLLSLVNDCGVLITSRSHTDAIHKTLKIKPLKDDDAAKLLQKWSNDLSLDSKSVKSICKSVGGLPLAVRLVGQHLNMTQDTASEYVTWLTEDPLKALAHGENRFNNAAILLRKSVDGLSDVARNVLAIGCWIAFAPFRFETLKAVLEKREVKSAINELINYGILVRNEQNYIISHALIHTYGSRELSLTDKTVDKLIAHYVTLFDLEIQDPIQEYEEIDAELAHLMAILSNCQSQQTWQHIINIVKSVDKYLERRGHWTQRKFALRYGINAACKLQDHSNQLTFMGNLGHAYRVTGQMSDAIEQYTQALTISRNIKDKRNEGIQQGNLGLAHYWSGQIEEARIRYENALFIVREVDNQQEEGALLGRIGNTYRIRGESKQAISYYKQARKICQKIGYQDGEMHWSGNLGVVYCEIGNADIAEKYIDQALQISRDIGNQLYEGTWLGVLGRVHYIRNKMDNAISFRQQALSIHRKLNYRQGIANQLGQIGEIYLALGQTKRAIENYEMALTIYDEITDPVGEGKIFENLGAAYKQLKQPTEAKLYFERALGIYVKIKSIKQSSVRARLAELT